MAFVVIYDACVLYPAPLRDLLIRIALTGMVRARWTDRILDECFGNITRNRPDIPAEALDRTRRLMSESLPDCFVTEYESLADGISLPDAGDRHVLAAAIRCGAQAIITFKLRDFPADALARSGIEAKHPDDFVLDALDLAPGSVLQAVAEQAAVLKSPPVTLPRLLDTLRDGGLEQSVARMRELFGSPS
jgi:hypothetical protein